MSSTKYNKGLFDRFEFRFKAYIYRSIRLCLNDSQGIPATILLCCAIDMLAKYYSGDPTHYHNKKKYLQFLRDYFPTEYNQDSFYAFVRSGLIHGFNLENRYAILCKNEDWAKRAHLKEDPKSGLTIINPFMLFSHLITSHKKFMSDIRSNPDLKSAFLKVHKELPLQQQQVRWKKMKHLRVLAP